MFKVTVFYKNRPADSNGTSFIARSISFDKDGGIYYIITKNQAEPFYFETSLITKVEVEKIG